MLLDWGIRVQLAFPYHAKPTSLFPHLLDSVQIVLALHCGYTRTLWATLCTGGDELCGGRQRLSTALPWTTFWTRLWNKDDENTNLSSIRIWLCDVMTIWGVNDWFTNKSLILFFTQPYTYFLGILKEETNYHYCQPIFNILILQKDENVYVIKPELLIKSEI